MYEKLHDPIVPLITFVYRFLKSLSIAIILIMISLIIGMLGYHYTEGLNWIDSFLNASMILSSMGPVDVLKTNSGKIFAGCYALFSGLILITVIAVVMAPIIHRFLHSFHTVRAQKKN